MALSQVIRVLEFVTCLLILLLLAFVLSNTLGKEALDDIGRRQKVPEANAEEYCAVSLGRSNPMEVTKKSRDLKVGDVLKVRRNQRLPADVVILKSVSMTLVLRANLYQQNPCLKRLATDLLESDQGPSKPAPNAADNSSIGDTFIRTDQLDGETDWKLRLTFRLSQSLPLSDFSRLQITASAPDKRVNEFVGTIELGSPTGFYDAHVDKSSGAQPKTTEGRLARTRNPSSSAPLTIDNTAWANTVLASNTTTYAVIIYTGSQTRAALSTSASRSKVGLLEYEINNLTKILCVLTLTLSIVLVGLEGFQPTKIEMVCRYHDISHPRSQLSFP